jgi:hypothetical protein
MTFRPICIIGRNKLLKGCKSGPVAGKGNAMVKELIQFNCFIINVILENTPETLGMSIVSDFRFEAMSWILYICVNRKKSTKYVE